MLRAHSIEGPLQGRRSIFLSGGGAGDELQVHMER